MNRKILIKIALIMFFIQLPAKTPAVNLSDFTSKTQNNTLIFKYHIPDEQDQATQDEIINNDTNASTDDDFTENTDYTDTTENISTETSQIYEDIMYENQQDQVNDFYTQILNGYVQYNQDEDDTIYLQDIEQNFLKFDIKKPIQVGAKSYTNIKTPSSQTKYSMFNTEEYSIIPVSQTNYRSFGGFSAGTTYNQGIDYGELEQTSGIFSRYQYKNLALNTAYQKTINSTNNNYNDNFYIAPEFMINQYFTLKQVLSADITRDTRKSEFILSINPFGRKDFDRLRFELGASQTYNNTNAIIKNQFKFSTKFKL